MLAAALRRSLVQEIGRHRNLSAARGFLEWPSPDGDENPQQLLIAAVDGPLASDIELRKINNIRNAAGLLIPIKKLRKTTGTRRRFLSPKRTRHRSRAPARRVNRPAARQQPNRTRLGAARADGPGPPPASTPQYASYAAAVAGIRTPPPQPNGNGGPEDDDTGPAGPGCHRDGRGGAASEIGRDAADAPTQPAASQVFKPEWVQQVQPFKYADFKNSSRRFHDTPYSVAQLASRPCPVTTIRQRGRRGRTAVTITVTSVDIRPQAAGTVLDAVAGCPLISPRAFVNVVGDTNRRRTTYRALYDSGAETSLLTVTDAARLRDAGVPLESVDKGLYSLRAANGTPMEVAEVVKAQLRVGTQRIIVPMIVSGDVDTSIIGTNAIDFFGLRPEGKELVMDPALRQRRTADSCEDAAPALVAKPIAPCHIPGRVGLLTTLQLHTYDGRAVRGTFDGMYDTGSFAARVTTDSNGRFLAFVNNMSVRPAHVFPKDAVGVVRPTCNYEVLAGFQGPAGSGPGPPEQPPQVSSTGRIGKEGAPNANDKLRQHTPEEDAAVKLLLRQNIEKNTPKENRQAMLAAVNRHPEAFSAHKNDIGRCGLLEHEIHLKTDQRLHTPQFRLASAHYDEIRDQVVAWLRAGIIRKERSAYNNPIFCVEKPHGRGLRVVSDFRTLNLHSHADRYSIPSCEEVFARIGNHGARVFTSLDLSSGFYHIPLRREDQPYTAFTLTGVGQFVWTRAAMGLCGAPATFSRVLDNLLHDLHRVQSYVDDIILWHMGVSEHADQLEVVLQRLTTAGLKVNPEKSAFGVRQVTYLGAEINQKGVRPALDKVEAIRGVEAPTTRKELSSVLGFFNYMAQYIFKYAEKVGPLQALTRKDVGWRGGDIPDDARRAFQRIKDEIIRRPTVSYLLPDKDLHLFVDCALGSSRDTGSGMGAVLLQDRAHGEKEPVAFISRQLKGSEHNYPSVVAEWKAAAWAVEKLSAYLRHRRFYLYSDCKPLVALNQHLKSAHKRTTKHCEMLLEGYHPIWQHVAGKANAAADFLSRHFGYSTHPSAPSNSKQRRRERELNIAAITNDGGFHYAFADRRPERILLLQRDDDDCQAIRRDIEQEVEGSTMGRPKWGHSRHVKHPVTIIDGFLCVKPTMRNGQPMVPRTLARRDGHEADGLLYFAPESMRPELIRGAHEDLGMHQGRDKTVARLRRSVWWPSMAKDVLRHIKVCDTCLRTTAAGSTADAPYLPIKTARRPNELWHVDLFGPVREGDEDGKYIMGVVDGLSNYTDLSVIPNKSAKSVCDKLLALVHSRGCPSVVTSDSGLEFRNTLQDRLWDALKVDRRWTSPYYPRVNGRAEVMNKVMADMIRKHRIDTGRTRMEFHKSLGLLQLTYNTSMNRSTKMTPHDVFYGYDPLLPLQLDFMPHLVEDTKAMNTQDFIACHLEQQRAGRATAHQNMEMSKAKAREYHDFSRPVQYPLYRPREAVLLKVVRKPKPNPKFAERWIPGFIIKRHRVKTFIVHHTGLKRHNGTTVWPADHIKPDPNREPMPHDEWVRRGGEDSQEDDDIAPPASPHDGSARSASPEPGTSRQDDLNRGLGRSSSPEAPTEAGSDRSAPVFDTEGDLGQVGDSDDGSDMSSLPDAARSSSPRTRGRRRHSSASSGPARSRSPRARGRDQGQRPGRPETPPTATTGSDSALPASQEATGDLGDASQRPDSQLGLPPPHPQPPAKRRPRRTPLQQLEDSQDTVHYPRRRRGRKRSASHDSDAERRAKRRERRDEARLNSLRSALIGQVQSQYDHESREARRLYQQARRIVRRGGALEILEALQKGHLTLARGAEAPQESVAPTETGKDSSLPVAAEARAAGETRREPTAPAQPREPSTYEEGAGHIRRQPPAQQAPPPDLHRRPLDPHNAAGLPFPQSVGAKAPVAADRRRRGGAAQTPPTANSPQAGHRPPADDFETSHGAGRRFLRARRRSPRPSSYERNDGGERRILRARRRRFGAPADSTPAPQRQNSNSLKTGLGRSPQPVRQKAATPPSRRETPSSNENGRTGGGDNFPYPSSRPSQVASPTSFSHSQGQFSKAAIIRRSQPGREGEGRSQWPALSGQLPSASSSFQRSHAGEDGVNRKLGRQAGGRTVSLRRPWEIMRARGWGFSHSRRRTSFH